MCLSSKRLLQSKKRVKSPRYLNLSRGCSLWTWLLTRYWSCESLRQERCGSLPSPGLKPPPNDFTCIFKLLKALTHSSHCEKMTRKRRNSFWIYPVLARRQQQGRFHGLIQELKLYHDYFHTYFRMPVGQFDLMLAELGSHLRRQSNHFRELTDRSSGCDYFTISISLCIQQ